MNNLGGTGLWDPTDGFYYDQLELNGQMIPLRSRSLVGLLPLIAVEVHEYRVDYTPCEGNTYLFGGNSNWRGPIWFPINYLLVEALERYHHFYGDALKVECPVGSGRFLNLGGIADELARRLGGLFLPNDQGARPCHGTDSRYAEDPNWRELVLFHEYFHADTGRGCGASHQTGWTALAVRCLEHFS
jgi:glycosyl hydrolase family 63